MVNCDTYEAISVYSIYTELKIRMAGPRKIGWFYLCIHIVSRQIIVVRSLHTLTMGMKVMQCQTRQRLSYLTTMTRSMFGGVMLWGFYLPAVLVNCTKWIKFFNLTWNQYLDSWNLETTGGSNRTMSPNPNIIQHIFEPPCILLAL